MNGSISKFILLILLTINPVLCFAFFCPTNFSQVEMGDTIEQIAKTCGAPAFQKESTRENENVPQEWSYFVPSTVAAPSYTFGTTGIVNQTQGTLRTSVSFDDQGRAINMTVNGIGVGATTICGRNIQLGDSRDLVKAACGEPQFINKSNNPVLSGDKPKEIKRVEYTYGTNPPTTLVFENGVLVERK